MLLTTNQAAEELGITAEHTLKLIHSSALEAINVATNPLGRPSWRINRAALECFIAARRNRNPKPVSRRRQAVKIHEYV